MIEAILPQILGGFIGGRASTAGLEIRDKVETAQDKSKPTLEKLIENERKRKTLIRDREKNAKILNNLSKNKGEFKNNLDSLKRQKTYGEVKNDLFKLKLIKGQKREGKTFRQIFGSFSQDENDLLGSSFSQSENMRPSSSRSDSIESSGTKINILKNIDTNVALIAQKLDSKTSAKKFEDLSAATSDDSEILESSKPDKSEFEDVKEEVDENEMIYQDVLNTVKRQDEQLTNDIKEAQKENRDLLIEQLANPDSFFKQASVQVKEFFIENALALKAAGTTLSSIIFGIERQLTAVSEISKEFSITSDNILGAYKEINTEQYLMRQNEERIYSSVQENLRLRYLIRREYGMLSELTTSQLDELSQFQRVLGVTLDEISGYLGSLQGINGEGVEFNKIFLQTLGTLSSANDIPFKDVMEDITSNAAFFSTYMSESSSEIGRMSVKLRKLGTDMSKFTGLFDSFDNIETLIQKQSKLNVMFGNTFDLFGVANDVMSGEGESAIDKMMEQLSSLDESALSNPILMKSLSEAIGLDVPELRKLIESSKGRNSLSMAQQKQIKTIEKFNETFANLGFERLTEAVNINFLNPVREALMENSGAVENIIVKLTDFLSWTGKVLGGIIRFVSSTSEFLSLGSKKLEAFLNLAMPTFVVGGITKGIQWGFNKMLGSPIEAVKIGHLKAIATNTAITAGTAGLRPSSNMKKGLLGLGRATLAGGAAAAATYGVNKLTSDSEHNRLLTTGTGILSGVAAGAYAGSAIAPVYGTVIGGVLGGIAGGVGGYMSSGNNNERQQFASGSIFTKPYRGNVEIAEAGNKEALIPLESNAGKEMLKFDISDRSIDQINDQNKNQEYTQVNDLKIDKDSLNMLRDMIIESLQKNPVMLNMVVNNKGNKKRMYIEEKMNPSSNLTINV